MAKLPTLLKKCPIINSICEFRYTGQGVVDQILPGLLHGSLVGHKSLRPVPPVPPELIRQDPNMQSIPTFNLEWEKFTILGNYTYVSVSSTYPYEGWENFKTAISTIFGILLDAGVFEAIQRISLKYIDFITLPSDSSPIDLLNLEIMFAKNKLQNENFALRINKEDDSINNILNIITDAEILDSGQTKNGVLLETDSLYSFKNSVSSLQISKEYKNILDKVHQKNKEIFFSILSSKALSLLEPEYDN